MNFSHFTTEQLQQYIKECSDKLLKVPSQSSMFDQIYEFKSYAEQELGERYFLERFQEAQSNVTQTVNIGIMDESVHTPDYNSEIVFDSTVTGGNA